MAMGRRQPHLTASHGLRHLNTVRLPEATRRLPSTRSQPNFIGKNASGTHDATLQHIMMTDADSEGYVQDDTSAATDDSITDDEEPLVKQDEP